jgi:hypothetical protein
MKKKCLSIILVITLLFTMLFGLTACGNKKDDDKEDKTGPEATVQEYFEDIGKLKFSKAFKLIDWTAYMMTSEEDYDYDEVEAEYDDFAEEYEDEIEELNDYLDSISDYAKETLEDYGTFKIKVKDVEDAEKVDGTKNIYSVNIKVEINIQEDDEDEDSDDDSYYYSDSINETETYEVYVMKSGSEYYIIGGIDDFMDTIF